MRKIAKPLLDIFLLVSLYIHSYLLLVLVINGYWDIPNWLIQPFILHHNRSDMEVKLDRFRLYPRKGFEITGLKVFSKQCLCPVIRIDEIRVVFSGETFDLDQPAKGVLHGGIIYFPDQYLPEEENLRLVENFSFQFDLDRTKLSINSLRANISKLSISSVNSIIIPVKAIRIHRDRNTPESKNSDSREFLDKLRAIRFIHQYFRDSDDASLTFSCLYDLDDGFKGAFNLFSEGSRFVNNVTTQNLYLYGEVHCRDKFSFGEGIHGELESIRYGSKLRIDGLSFLSKYKQGESFIFLPSQLMAHAKHIEYNGNVIDYVSTDVFPEDMDKGSLVLDLGIQRQSISVNASYDLKRKHAEIDLNGDFNLLNIARNGWLQGKPKLSFLDIPGIPHIEGSFSLDNWNEFNDVRFKIVTEDIVVDGASFDYARGEGSLKNNKVVLDDFAVTKPLYTLRGKLTENFSNDEYRYLLYGSALPADLNPMFHSWWTKIWTKFQFNQHPITADIDIWGVHETNTRRYTYGKIGVEGISYKGLPIEKGKIRLNTIPKYTRLFDLDVLHARGVARGSIKAVYQYDGTELLSERLDLFNNIPFHEIAPVVGDALDLYVENTNPEVAPELRVKGCIIEEGLPEYNALERLEIKIHQTQPFEFFGVGMDSIDAVVLKTKDEVTVSPITFGFANGHGNGVFHVIGEEPDRILDFKVDISDFNYHVAGKKIKSLNEADSPDEMADTTQPVAENSRKPRAPSLMDLSLAGSCPLGDWSGLRGKGRFELDDPLIHRVHVFGGFSKLMDNAELNLGSFSLKQATSPLRVEGKKVYFEDLELTGPSSRVKAKGVVNLEDKTLDFRLKSYPLGEVKFPVVAGIAFLLRPITFLFEVKVSGPLDDPEWKLVLDPSGL